MSDQAPLLSRDRYLIFIILSILIIFLSYSNSFYSSWHFDDFGNILENSKIHLKELNVDGLKSALFANPDGSDRLHRPVSFITFALNYYFGGYNVVGYHIINIVIHIFNFIILFKLLEGLSRAPALPEHIRRSAQAAALPAALLWALNPIQVQAITYIVQRVASLAVLFYLLGLLCYVLARLQPETVKRYGYFFITLLCFLLAMGSKENAATFPLAVILVEYLFFRKKAIRWNVVIVLFSCIILAIIGVSGVVYLNKLGIYDTYTVKTFTLAERLMTETRIVLLYLTQIFYPVPMRLSFFHEIPVSRGLLSPPTTILSIALISGLILACIKFARKMPILCFPFAFFLLGHVVESTILPLELMYEHRNYLPSAFLFWPIFFYSIYATKNFKLSRFMSAIVISCLVVYGASFSLWTYQRNNVWRTEESLWTDVAHKSPNLARPYQFMAMAMAGKGEMGIALDLYNRSLDKYDETPARSVWLAHNNMGLIYMDLGQLSIAQEHFEKALSVMSNDFDTAFPNLVKVLIKQGKYGKAEALVDKALDLAPGNGVFLHYKGFLCLRTNRPDEALRYFRAAGFSNIDSRMLRYNMAMALILGGYKDQADAMLNELRDVYGDEIILLAMKAENALRAGEKDQFGQVIESILRQYTITDINSVLVVEPDNLPLSAAVLKAAFERVLDEQITRLERK